VSEKASRDDAPPPPRAERFSLRLRGLKAQIVLWTVLPVTLVLIGVAFTGVYSHEQAMRVLVDERNRALAIATAAQVRELLDAQASALVTVAAEEALRHGDRSAQSTLLASVGSLNGLFMDSVALLDETGQTLAAGKQALGWMQDEHTALALTREVIARHSVSVTTILGSTPRENSLLMGVPVHLSSGSGIARGVLAGPVSMDGMTLGALLSQSLASERAVVYLVDGSGQVLAHSPSERQGQELTLDGHTGLPVSLRDAGPGATLCVSPAGERMTLAYAPVTFEAVDWRVIVQQPWDEVIGPVLRYSQFMPLVALLAAVVSLLSLYYGVQAIARPLRALGQRAERIAWGDFDATSTPVGGVEEIEDLRRTLDTMAKRIQRYQTTMHSYVGAITRGQEEERKRLARELHDDTTQSLIVLGQRVEVAQKLLPHEPGLAAEHLTSVKTMLAQTLDGIRRLSRDLRPAYLEDLGFIPAVEVLAHKADGEGRVSVQFTTSGRVRRLPPDLEMACYRIVQEALSNVIQHANATHAWLEVRFEDRHLVLSVRDDGDGFEDLDLPDALAAQGHFGLVGVRERAILHAGQLTVHSAPGTGTHLLVRLPYSARS